MPTDLSWLNHSIPLWAFLLALLTSPHQWAKRAVSRLGPVLDIIIPGTNQSDEE